MDTFERAAIGSNWYSTGYQSGGTCVITGSSDLTATGAAALCNWTPQMPLAASSYACARTSGIPVNGSAAVCLGVDGTSGGYGVCCTFNPINGDGFSLSKIVAGVGSNVEFTTSPTYPPGTWIGIQRTSATGFRCYSSTNGTSWAALGSGIQTIASIPNPGAWGAYPEPSISGFYLETWEGGDGALPTSRACGTP